jgi:hypothetical protein
MKRLVYRFVRFWVKLFYPRIKVVGEENLPEGPAVVVGNHAKMNAPISCQLYFPGKFCIWTAGEMMHLREVPEYAFNDFWSDKPGYIRWFYKGLSYAIAPLSVCIFNSADCIGVYHDNRVMSTFRKSIEKLHEGVRIIILPEHYVPYSNIVWEFSERFVDVARMYYRKYGEEISFVPMYAAPGLRSLYLGKAIKYDAKAPAKQERKRITGYLMDEITDMARSLPEHTVVPYPNIPKKEYPSNKAYSK